MRLRHLTAAVAVFATFFLSACSILFPAEDRTTPPPIIEPESFEYVTEEVIRESIVKSVRRNGTYTALVQYKLTFEKRGGYLKELNMGFNQRVSAGEILASIDTDDLERQIAQQTLVVEAAQIDYNNALRQVAAAKENYERVSAMASQDKKIAKKELEEKREQHEYGEIDDLELSKAESAYKHRIAEIDNLVTQAGNAANSQADEKAFTSLRQAQLRLSDLKDEYSKTVIRSPIDGVITFVEELRIGSYVEARKTVVTVADDSQLLLLIVDPTDSETFYSDFPMGATVNVWTSGLEYDGTIVFTPADAPINDSLSDYPYILIEVEDIPYDKVSIGTLAVVSINTEYRENVITVPSNAVQRYGEYSFVRVYEEGVSRERPVELGLITPTRIEIISGLKVGESVIIR